MLARSLLPAATLLAAVTVAWLTAPAILAQDCVDYEPQAMAVMDLVAIPSSIIYDVEVSGDLAFVGASNGVYAFDVSDPRNLLLLGSYSQFGCIHLALSGHLMCIASQDHGIIFVDVTDPAAMTFVGQVPELTFVQGVVAHGDYFYVGGNHQGVYPVDATDPADPIVHGPFAGDGTVRSLAAQGPYLSTVSYGSQLEVWDLADPLWPVSISGPNQNGDTSGSDILPNGNLLYIADYPLGAVKVVDVSVPQSPVRLGAVATPNDVFALAMIGNHLFGGNVPTLNALDITSPAAPQLIGRLVAGLEIWDLEPHGDHLLGVASDNLLVSLDVSQPNSTLPLGRNDTDGDARSVTFGDANYFVANGADGLLIRAYGSALDVSRTALSGPLLSVTLRGDLAYLAMDDRGLQIADVSDPAAPVLLDDVDTPGHACRVDIYTNASGSYAMVADREYDLVKYDVTDPSHILPKGVNLFLGHVYDLQVYGHWLLIADNSGLLHVMDLSVLPDQPAVVAELEVAGNPVRLAREGTTLFVAGGLWLNTVDLADPLQPRLLDSIRLDSPPLGLAVSGGVAYCSLYGFGTCMVDVTDPTELSVLSTFRSTFSPHGIGIHDGRVYLCVGPDGLEFLPLQCLVSPAADPVPRQGGRWLHGARPNPFNPLTTLAFDLPRAASVHLEIFDLAGRLVRTLIPGSVHQAGSHQLQWDGCDDRGRAAPSGVYLCRLTAGEVREAVRLALVR